MAGFVRCRACWNICAVAHYVEREDRSRTASLTVIVILALVALFIGLRLYSVLGERTGHEQQPILKPADPDARVEPRVEPARGHAAGARAMPATWRSCRPRARAFARSSPPIRAFDVARFLEGAKAAYRLILEAFWKGDLDAVRGARRRPCLRNLRRRGRAAREGRADARQPAGRDRAGGDRRSRGRARRRALSRCASKPTSPPSPATPTGEVVAGSLSDAVQTRDLWTFRRDIALARSQLAADRDRRGRVRLLGSRARARFARCCSPPARPGRSRRPRRRRRLPRRSRPVRRPSPPAPPPPDDRA